MDNPIEELTMQEVADLLGVTRSRLNQMVKADAIPSRLEITPEGRTQRLIKREVADALLMQRQQSGEGKAGRGRPVKLPGKAEATT